MKDLINGIITIGDKTIIDNKIVEFVLAVGAVGAVGGTLVVANNAIGKIESIEYSESGTKKIKFKD